MLKYYGTLLLVTSLLFVGQPSRNNTLPVILAETLSHNLIIDRF